MKFLNPLSRLSPFLVLPVLACTWAALSVPLRAAPPAGEQTFASPDDAIKALKAAAASGDDAAMQKLFGPDFHELLTGDKVQDAGNAKHLAAGIDRHCEAVKNENGTITLEIGRDDWPMPIPLVQSGGQWYFDTAAGKEEVIDRHVGHDELAAIGVCRAYVKAQKQFAGESQDQTYAEHFKSAAGKRDGLYWPATDNAPESPFGPLVAEAQAEGYVVHARGTGPHPFHGYFFRILKAQGEAAPGGKMDYVSKGKMTGGFALVAYPEQWDKSGVMTFIVNQDGKVSQCNLGEDTSKLAPEMKDYNPDSDWTPVTDEGISRAVSER